MAKTTLTFDWRSLLCDYNQMHDCFEQHLSSMTDDDAWLIAENFAKTHAFVVIIGDRFPDIVASVSEEMAKYTLEEMRDWSEGVSPIDGWPEKFLNRLK